MLIFIEFLSGMVNKSKTHLKDFCFFCFSSAHLHLLLLYLNFGGGHLWSFQSRVTDEFSLI